MTRRMLPASRLRGLRLVDRGLTSVEVADRRREYGANLIVETPPGRWWDLARETLKDPMLWFLAGVSAIYGALGEFREALPLLLAIVPLVGMDTFLHRRTQASTEGLKSRLAERATVVRDGAQREVPAIEVVPGDLVVVSAGEAFPADGVVLEGDDLQVDESSLTGEAYPVPKRVTGGIEDTGAEVPVAAEHWVLAGTRLLTGRALVRLVFTGGETLYGEIAHSALAGSRSRTPLQTAIQGLVGTLIGAAAVICVILAIVRLQQGFGWLDATVSAATLAVAALPEEFPVVFTFFLGVGVYRLAKRQALVRRAVSVENIGRVTAICSDKTGTITEGHLHLTHLVPAPGVTERRLLYLAALASRGESGDPLDAAILVEARATGAITEGPEPLATFPYTERRKRETAIVRLPDGELVSVAKGAAESLLAMTTLSAGEQETWSRRIDALAGEGHKVIGCGWRTLKHGTWEGEEVEAGYELAGLLAFEDPPRAGVAQAVSLCRLAGIHTIMVTGDHPLTARAVAQEIGLGGGDPCVATGDEVEGMVSRGEHEALRRIDVIARAAPAQKHTLVRGLQEAGELVVVTGDGVNDVPALQAADVGVAMGERGTRSAREIASIVLLDDNFRTIVGAIAEGRQLFRNLRLSFTYLLAIHIPFVASALVVPLLGYPLLYLPVHIVWLELIIHPTALLVFQEIPDTGLERAGPGSATRFFSAREWILIALIGGLLALFVVGGYIRSVEEHGVAGHGRAMALAILALASAGLVVSLSGLRTGTARVIAAATIAASAVLIQVPTLAQALHLEPLHVLDWSMAVGVSALASALPAGLLGPWRRSRRPAVP